MSEKEKMIKEEVSKETKVQVTPQDEVKEYQLYPGITVIKDENFIPRKDLTRDDIKKFSIVKVVVSSVFKEGQNPRITFKLFPFVCNPHQQVIIQGKKVNEYTDLFRLNDDVSNNIRLSANEYTSLLIASNMKLEHKNKVFSMLKYARFITGVSQKDNRRYYKVQLFLSFDNVKTLWLSETEMSTISTLIVNKFIDPVSFVEVSSDELEIDDVNTIVDDLI